ncbi:MAG: WYL domain-containing protein [Oscillospiraceae bacterium]|nr:WYL domain-containing protein [Oscillospiraceae bacterium]
MAKSPNQKLKLLYLMDYFKHYTDEKHLVSTADMIAYLAKYDISAERKSIYDDIEALRVFGMDIMQVRGAGGGYYLASRDFELPELKLLVDSVQSSRFITSKKTMALIKKVEALTSVHEAKALHRQVYVSGRIKTMNESIYYNVDEIHSGIASDRQIAFKYFEYSVTKERRFRRGGDEYIVSPYALTWNSENYYMIAFDSASGQIRHYRVDKMTAIRVTDMVREGKDELGGIDMAEYTGKVFGMFSGSSERVKLECEAHLAGAVIDRFGKDVIIVSTDPDSFTVTVDVVVSPQFLAWVFGFEGEMRIVSPDSAAEKMKALLEKSLSLY